MSNRSRQLLGWTQSPPADVTNNPLLFAFDIVWETSLDVLNRENRGT